MTQKNSFQILHISDLHINQNDKSEFDRSVTLEAMINRVKADIRKGFGPEIIAVTGDIAYSGITSEYETAKAFFDQLRSACSLSDDGLFFVPGNHDINRQEYRPSEILKYENMEDLNRELKNEVYRKDLLKGMTEYGTFFNAHYPHLQASHDDLIPFVNMVVAECGKAIGLVGLNSSWMCRRSNGERKIAIGEFQVQTALDLLDKMGRPDITILMFHHPLSWLMTMDARICRDRFNGSVLLCGHLHEAEGGYFHTYDASLYQFQAGGLDISPQAACPNRFQYITFDWNSRSIRLDFRKYDREGRKWVVDAETEDDGVKSLPIIGTKGKSCDMLMPELEIPETYSSWINDHCTYMDVDNLQIEGHAIRIELPEVFIPLYTNAIDVSEKKPRLKQVTVDLEDMIANHDYLLIEGEAGSGKTTLFKHLAYCLVGKTGLRVCIEKMHGYLPVLIFLKDLRSFLDKQSADCGCLTVKDILSFYCKNIENVIDMEVVTQFCKQGKAVFLLDGLDEISPAGRTAIVNAFSNFKSRYKGVKIIPSGRPHGVAGIATDRFGKFPVKILPLTMEQVESFIKNWFKFIYDRSLSMGEKDAGAMISEIRANRAVEKLIENPLMLTAICILYHGGRELPGQRAELYKKFIGNLLRRRFSEPEKVYDFLRALAYRMQETGTRGCDKFFAVNEMEHVFTDEQRQKLEQRFVEEIEPQCGLMKLEDGQYNFRHLTFQEYLTAAYLIANHTDYRKAIERYWEDEQYKEVIELYIGTLSIDNKRWANAIVEEILNRDDQPPYRNWRLAARSMLDMHPNTREISVVDLATERLRKIIVSEAPAIERADAGETLGRLGDRRDLESFVQIKGGKYQLSTGTFDIKAFEMTKYPVTNQWFAKFIKDGGYNNEKYWTAQGKLWLKKIETKYPRYWHDYAWNCPNAPVVGICWYEADAFCRWLTFARKDGWLYILPDVIYWEAAAAGSDQRKYPWGNIWQEDRCNTYESEINKTSSVGIFFKGNTPEGIADMIGNVWEWTRTDFRSSAVCSDFGIIKNANSPHPVQRGCAFGFDKKFAQSAHGVSFSTFARDNYIGFRCLRIPKM